MVILGTQYAGEMKKGIFSVMHYLMPKRGILSLHSGCNVGASEDVSLFFGLSGAARARPAPHSIGFRVSYCPPRCTPAATWARLRTCRCLRAVRCGPRASCSVFYRVQGFPEFLGCWGLGVQGLPAARRHGQDDAVDGPGAPAHRR